MTVELTNEERFAMLRSVGEECILESELKNLIEKKPNIRCYDGFEPSGRMHIAQGIFKAVNVNKCTTCGCSFVFWVADWFALMNDKVGGELEKIRIVGRYLIEVWKAAGMDMSKVIFLWSSEEITSHAEGYWKQVLDIGRRNTIARIKKCCTIMGKSENTLTGAQVLYPLMQCSDIFFLKADICQLGLDQRKVNMLAREYCDLTNRKLKPVILSHHMLAGLKQGQAKMSKSDPDSAIFMEDTAEDVERKVRQAYCPRVAQKANEIADDGAPSAGDDKNPILDYYQCIIFAKPNASTTINGRCFATYDELEGAFIGEEISETDLKDNLVLEINKLLDPVRQHFATNPEAGQLLEQVKTFRKGGVAPEPVHETVSVDPKAKPHAILWVPATIKLPLSTATSIVRSIVEFTRTHEGAKVSVILPEWSAFASDDATGEEKTINAVLQFNLKLLQAYGLPSSVTVVSENNLVLADSNAFWVSVINVGRKTSLQEIEQHQGELKNAGQVIAAMMRTAEAVMLGATFILNTEYDHNIAEIAVKFSNQQIKSLSPAVVHIPPLHRPDSIPQPLGADDVLNLDDNEMDIRRKIKKAYAAPNEYSNPVISLGTYVILSHGQLNIERDAANGGHVQYTSAEELANDCRTGALHPADLKTAVTQYLLENSAPVRAALDTADLKKLSQTLRNAEKKLSKKK